MCSQFTGYNYAEIRVSVVDQGGAFSTVTCIVLVALLSRCQINEFKT